MSRLMNAIYKDDFSYIKNQVRFSSQNILDWNSDRPPIIMASKCGAYRCLSLFFEHLDNVGFDKEIIVKYLNTVKLDGKTALYYAVENNNTECTRLLLKYGANPNSYCKNCFGVLHTPMDMACENDSIEILRLLIQYDGKFEIKSSDLGITPLFIASMKNSFHCADYLISLGAKVNDQSKNGNTPLHYAQLSNIGNNTECTKLLLENGADVNAKNLDGLAPLHLAAMNCNDKAIVVLLSYGADINCQNENNGETPLHVAIPDMSQIDDDYDYDRALEAINVLLSYHPDLEIKDWDDMTPLFVAVMRSNVSFVRVLLEHGADVNTSDKWGMSVLEHVIYLYETEYLRWGGCYYPDLCDAIYEYVDDDGKRRIDEVRQQGEK